MIRPADLPLIEPKAKADEAKPSDVEANPMRQDASTAPVSAASPSGMPVPVGSSTDDIVATIERLAELRRKGILTKDEFTAKKAEWLSHL